MGLGQAGKELSSSLALAGASGTHGRPSAGHSRTVASQLTFCSVVHICWWFCCSPFFFCHRIYVHVLTIAHQWRADSQVTQDGPASAQHKTRQHLLCGGRAAVLGLPQLRLQFRRPRSEAVVAGDGVPQLLLQHMLLLLLRRQRLGPGSPSHTK